MIYSFDIFDTLITRTTATPTGIFCLMQETIRQEDKYKDISQHIRNNFYYFRKDAEVYARQWAQRENREVVSLKEIYDCFLKITGIPFQYREELINLEVSTEKDNIVPIYSNINRVKALLDNEEKVFLISDMYLSEETIREILLIADEVFRTIPIIVSCDVGKTKKSGRIYKYFLETNQIDANEWKHIGDNLKSDYENVIRCGGSAELFELYCFNCFERDLIYKNEADGSYQKVMGSIKNSFLTTKHGMEMLGNRFGGPILYSYVRWVLEEAVLQKVTDIYFIARDGYILKRIADEIINEYKISMRTHYLYGSRIAWRVSSLNDPKIVKEWILKKSRFSALNDFAEYIGINEKKIRKCIGYEIPEGKLSSREISVIKCLLAENKELVECICDRQKEQKRKVKGYLEQELQKSGEKIAFVDLQGSGYSLSCIVDMLTERQKQKGAIAFFYTMSEVTPDSTRGICYKRYICGNVSDDGIIELFSRAPHGQTLSYEYDDEKKLWDPILQNKTVDAVDEVQIEMYWEGLKSFINGIHRFYYIDSSAMSMISRQFLEQVKNKPENKIKDLLGEIPFSSKEICGEKYKYAPMLSMKQLRELYFWKDETELQHSYTGNNLEFSKSRMSTSQRRIASLYRMLSPMAKLFSGWKKRSEKFQLSGDIVLYGAGKVGKYTYETLKLQRDIRIVAWVDQAWIGVQERRLAIKSPSILTKIKFDYVIVCVANANIMYEIREQLQQMGIDEKKIF